MREFANFFLMLFVADAGLSLLDEALSYLGVPLPLLSGIRGLTASLAVMTAVLLYVCLGIDRRLPKRLFLPLLYFLFLVPVLPFFYPTLSGRAEHGLLLALAQVLLCMVMIFRFGRKNPGGAILHESVFSGPVFGVKNTVLFTLANLFLLPLAFVLLVAGTANSYLHQHSAGFIRLAPDGVRMTERIYGKDGKTVRLAAMIHVGEKEYYDELAESLPSGKAVVLAEGVTDEGKLLQNMIDYDRVAGLLGLTSQERLLFRGRLIDEAELDRPRSPVSGKGPDILRADVDLRSFRPETIRFLNAIGEALHRHDSLADGLISFNGWTKRNLTPELQQVLMDDILHRRNKVLIGHLRKGLKRYDTVIIPWGALHMAEIEQEVLAQGFRLQHERERLSIDLARILRDVL